MPVAVLICPAAFLLPLLDSDTFSSGARFPCQPHLQCGRGVGIIHSEEGTGMKTCSVVLLRLALALAVLVLGSAIPQFLWADVGVLENPPPNSFQSGIGIVSGWKCTAGNLTFTIDNGPSAQLVYGTSRLDTRSVCGHSNTGFAYLINWNLAGNGQHTIRVYDNGVQFVQATFTATTLGTEFLHSASGRYILPNFPLPGVDVSIRWQESAQNFVLDGVRSGGGGGGGSCPGLITGPYDLLEGAQIFANNGQFLGVITTNRFSSDALCNEFGTYGSKFSSVSILNQFGIYGSQFSNLSPFNQFTSTPPVIVKNGTAVAYLTLNTALSPRVDPYALIGWLRTMRQNLPPALS